MRNKLSTISKQDGLDFNKVSKVHFSDKNMYGVNDYPDAKPPKSTSYKRGTKGSMMAPATLTLLVVFIFKMTFAVLLPSPFYVAKLQLYQV